VGEVQVHMKTHFSGRNPRMVHSKAIFKNFKNRDISIKNKLLTSQWIVR
jgi:hypothetical protein